MKPVCYLSSQRHLLDKQDVEPGYLGTEIDKISKKKENNEKDRQIVSPKVFSSSYSLFVLPKEALDYDVKGSEIGPAIQ